MWDSRRQRVAELKHVSRCRLRQGTPYPPCQYASRLYRPLLTPARDRRAAKGDFVGLSHRLARSGSADCVVARTNEVKTNFRSGSRVEGHTAVQRASLLLPAALAKPSLVGVLRLHRARHHVGSPDIDTILYEPPIVTSRRPDFMMQAHYPKAPVGCRGAVPTGASSLTGGIEPSTSDSLSL